MQTYRNPVIPFDKPDVTVLRVGEDYYLTGSHHAFPSLPFYHSRDLVHWEFMYYAVTDPDLGVRGGAPDLVKVGDLYYLYLMNGRNGIYVMTCTDIAAGDWSVPTPLGIGPVAEEDRPEDADTYVWDYNLGFIDPGHVIGEDGKRYLFVSGGYMFGLSDDGLSVVTPPRKVYDPWPIPESWKIEGYYIEAMSLFKRGEYFYLMAAQGGTFGPATGHMAVSMRSRSVFGPWEHSPYNPIVHAGSVKDPWWCRGHATVLEDTAGEWHIIYHAEERDFRCYGRQTVLEPIVWDDDGWFHVPEGTRPEDDLPLPAGSAVNDVPARSDDFLAPELGAQWSVRDADHYRKENWAVGDGRLALKALGSDMADGMKLMQILGDHAWRMSAEVEPSGTASGGIGVYLTPACYVSLELKDGVIGIARPARGGMFWKKEIGKKCVRMEMTCESDLIVCFRWEDDEGWHRAQFDTDISAWCQESFGAVPVCPMLFSYGGGETIFRHVVYERL